jgi:ribonuclease HI
MERSDCFEYLVDRICKIISGWNEKNLYTGGKEILLKAIAQAIPTYAMSVFKIPKGIIKAISAAIARFWWGEKDGKKSMHWYSWWKMCTPKKEGGMGFRDLHCFNLAMLSKQIWRLANDPTSLCAQVLSAKYYPSGDVMQATRKKGASFTWQSLMAGMETFKRGFIWRVGNGSNINIWSDPWLPNSPTRKIFTPRGGVLLTKVEDLINPITGAWDVQLLEDNFIISDVRRIVAIPLSNWESEDMVAWHYNKNGMFTVKSAYHVEWQHQYGSRSRRNDQQSSSIINPVWGKVWKLNVPAKVKIFTWRALHGIIPCMCILANRHIESSGQCPLCEIAAEDIKHMLFTCDKAREVWQALGLEHVVREAARVDRSGSTVLEHILTRKHQVPSLGTLPVHEIIATAGWFIWWRRRETKFGGTVPLASRSALSIKAMVANCARTKINRHGTMKQGWTKPPAGYVKVNTDAAVDLDSRVASTGCIIRDSSGQFLAACRAQIEGVLDVVTAEAQALRDGLRLAERIGCNHLYIETDSQEVVDAIKEPDQYRIAGMPYLDECREIVAGFASTRLNHCAREVNKAADAIARSVVDSEYSFWIDDPPLFLYPQLVDDVTIL